jgi:N-acetyl-anhydromuramyl-L-alanine amidase AmpD
VLNKYPPDVSPYLRYQYYALIELIHDLQNTYGLDPDKVISHSEVKMTARYPDNATPPAPGPPGSWIYDEGTHGKEQDPGQHFDWTQLEEAGIGRKLQGDVDLATAYGGFFHFFHDKSLKMGDSDGPTPTRPTRPTREFGGMRNDIDRVTVSPMGPVEELQRDLELIGYSLGPENSAGLRSNVGQYDDNTRRAVKRFQLHFLSGPTRTPHLRNGQVNATLATMIKQVLNYLTQSP